MKKALYRSPGIAGLLIAVAISLSCFPAAAQNQNGVAIRLLGKAMDYYSNLDMDSCKATLKEARDLAMNIDRTVLARIYASYGVLWSGGYGDNGKGQNNFLIAICLDPATAVDPLYLTPDIETIFKLAKGQAIPETCTEVLSTIPVPPAPKTVAPPPPPPAPKPVIAACGEHKPLGAQKKKYELPFFIKLHSSIQQSVKKIVVHYAFDSSTEWGELTLKELAKGYGAMLTCDKGGIRTFDPAKISYYIEGQDSAGKVLCGHGTIDAPLQVAMQADVKPLPEIAGMQPEECKPCPPWGCDLPKEGEECTPDPGCQKGLVCSDFGVCESKKAAGPKGPGPEVFYVNLAAGSGVGYFSMDSYTINRILENDQTAQIAQYRWKNAGGFAWNGIPLRLAIGFLVLPELSLEVTARLDVNIKSRKEPKSCADANADANSCSTGTARDPKGVALTSDDPPKYIYTQKTPIAWITNIRARYRAVTYKSLAFAVFGGVGYGHAKYRLPVKNSKVESSQTGANQDRGESEYYPTVGMVDIEIGPALTYFFIKNVGLFFEMPIDFLVGDGFGFNLDFMLGLQFGF